jgi:hypothetical protein
MVNATVQMDVEAHLCCGEAVERDEGVDLACTRWQDPDGRVHVLASHHAPPHRDQSSRAGRRHRLRGRRRLHSACVILDVVRGNHG